MSNFLRPPAEPGVYQDEINNLHHPPDHGQADADQRVNSPIENAVDEELDEVKKHGSLLFHFFPLLPSRLGHLQLACCDVVRVKRYQFLVLPLMNKSCSF